MFNQRGNLQMIAQGVPFLNLEIMPLETVGNIIGSAVQGAANYGIAKMNNAEALKREKLARQENYTYGEKAADAADARTRALYGDLYSPQAQIQQIKEAGLSPAIFGGNGQGISGKGGVSGAQGNGANGVNPQVFGMSPIDFAQMGLIQAQTKKTEAETDNIDTDTELKGQQIINLVADTNNKRAELRLINAEADLADLEFMDNVETRQARISQAYSNAQSAAAAARSAVVQADLDEATFDAAYKMAYANLDNVLTDTALKESQINVTKAQIKEISERICKSQWERWAIEKDQNRKDAIFKLDRARLEAECKKWAAELNVRLTEAELKIVSELVGYICNVATCGMSNATKLKQTEMYNKTKKDLKTHKEVSTETIVDGNGKITTKSKTRSRN